MLSIIGLTLVIRAALIPLFVKQIKSSRNMQLIQPKVRELQKKYGHDRERLAQETMELYKETGTNPFASCLPILLQMPIFLALFRLIDQAAEEPRGRARPDDRGARHASSATRRSSARTISDTFMSTDLTAACACWPRCWCVAMTATTFLTQRQLMSKNMPADALTGPYAQQQKMLLYVLPLVFAVGGIAFPIGVLFYWTTSNLWTMGQQFYVIRNNPAPGTPAAEGQGRSGTRKKAASKAERRDPARWRRRPSRRTETPPAAPPRQQPKKQTRSQRKKKGPAAARQGRPLRARTRPTRPRTPRPASPG